MSSDRVSLTLMGTIRDHWGAKELYIPITENPMLLETLLKKCAADFKDNFWEFFDSDFTPKRGTIILIDGVDFSVSGGLKTVLNKDTKIIF